MVANGDLAKILRLTPEEFIEKYKTGTFNLGQIAVIANFMDLSMEQTMKKFFPDFMYRRSVIRRKGGSPCREQG